jgi:hypothetical protein
MLDSPRLSFEHFTIRSWYGLLHIHTADPHSHVDTGVAASARVGNFIGARSASGAKHAGHAAALLSVIVGTVVMCTMMATKDVCRLFMRRLDLKY